MPMHNFGPCMCGATDCPSCGPAQGYVVVKRWNGRHYVFENPEEDDEEIEEGVPDEPEHGIKGEHTLEDPPC